MTTREQLIKALRAFENDLRLGRQVWIPASTMQAAADMLEADVAPVAYVITDENINSLQAASIGKLIQRCKHAHHTDLVIRINGKDEHYEADWVKHLTAAPHPTIQERKPLTTSMSEDIAMQCAKLDW